VARPPRGRSGVGSWQWARTAETQRALLDAARAVFTGQGFADASIADVVERAGSSVGSLYHHFGGKSELFIALWQDYQQAQEADASEAVARARKAGVTDPFELFSAGARAFMEGCWLRRDLAVLQDPGSPPAKLEQSLYRLQRVHPGLDRAAFVQALAGLVRERRLSPAVRRNAALALAKLGCPDAGHRGALREALADPDPSLRAVCRWALHQLALPTPEVV